MPCRGPEPRRFFGDPVSLARNNMHHVKVIKYRRFSQSSYADSICWRVSVITRHTDKRLGLIMTEYQGRRSNGSAEREMTDGRTDRQMGGRTLPSTLSPIFVVDKNTQNTRNQSLFISVGSRNHPKYNRR